MQSSDFIVLPYLTYKEMVGIVAGQFTWLSVLLFDNECRKWQTAEAFAWGTEVPHLSPVALCDRSQQQQNAQYCTD